QGPTVRRGDGRETGDQRNAVVHVTDLAQAALLAGRPSAVYNLGNERGHSVREVIATARRAGDPAVPAAGSARIRREPGGRRAAGTWRPSSARPGNGMCATRRGTGGYKISDRSSSVSRQKLSKVGISPGVGWCIPGSSNG
ncbi:hypothetical protein ACUM6F_12600, partial [Desulforudis sp. DRI-14]